MVRRLETVEQPHASRGFVSFKEASPSAVWAGWSDLKRVVSRPRETAFFRRRDGDVQVK